MKSDSCSEGDVDNISKIKPSKVKKGIVYLASIPKYMTVVKLKELLSAYGEVGRIFLQPAKIPGKKVSKRKVSRDFTEGWVEFEKKSVAKQVASYLNNTKIAGRKKSKFYDEIWSMKYLPGFKWVHLNERLAYERAVRKQRIRAEIASAKREVNYFSQNVERSKKLSKYANGINKMELTSIFELYPQRQLESDQLNVEQNKQNSDVIKNIFGV